VSLLSKPPIMRVAIVRDLDSTANFCFEGAPEPRYFAPCLEPYPALCRSVCYWSDAFPLQLNFPPTIAPQAGILKAGAAGIEFPLKAKHVLVPVIVGDAAAQRFTFSTSTLSGRSFDQLGSDDAWSEIFGQHVLGLACDCECRTAQRL
jgi:hypothetical protein